MIRLVLNVMQFIIYAQGKKLHRFELDVPDDCVGLLFMWLEGDSCVYLTALPLYKCKNENWLHYSDRKWKNIDIVAVPEWAEWLNLEGLVVMFNGEDIEVFEAWNPFTEMPYGCEYFRIGHSYLLHIYKILNPRSIPKIRKALTIDDIEKQCRRDVRLVAKIIFRNYMINFRPNEYVGTLFLNKRELKRI